MRWRAVVTYRTENGPLPVPHDIEELGELEDLVELGPDWNTITEITIRLRSPGAEDYTVEKAELE